MSRCEYSNNFQIDSTSNFDDLFSSTVTFTQNDGYDNLDMNIVSSDNLTEKSVVSNLECRVCGAPAHGYNFNQITCESCKAFFRRNALRNQPELKCRFSGSCVINIDNRRHCTYCRLKKCFDVQMRKDWIRTDEEKTVRQLRKLAKQQKKINNQSVCLTFPIVARKKNHLTIFREQTVQPINFENFFGIHRNLEDNDRVILNNIMHSYDSEAKPIANSSRTNPLESRSLVQFLNGEKQMHESLIYFYKKIPEFKQLHIDDQILLIKCNLVKNMNLHYIIVQNFQENPLIGLCMSQWINRDFHDAMSRTRRYFYQFKEHPLVLKLALVVFLFSVNLSLPKGTYQHVNYVKRMDISRIQEFYTTLLWRYLNCLLGERAAIRAVEIIVTQILRFQTLMNEMEETLKNNSDSNEVNPLIQSIFQMN